MSPLAKRLIGIAVIIAGIAAPLYLSGYNLSLAGRFLALGLAAMGLVLLWGEGGILSLGQGVFFGLGGYVIAMHMQLAGMAPGETMPEFMIWSGLKELPTWWNVFRNPFVSVVGVIVVPAVVAAIFGWLIFRRRIGGVYFALITQGLALAFATLLISQQAFTGGFNGLTNYKTLFGFTLNDAKVSLALYWITLGIVVVCFFIGRYLLASRFGKLLRATRDNTNRVRFLGYDPTPIKIVAFVAAAILSGLSGALFSLHAGVISPAMVGVVPSIEIVIWAAVGGRASLAGAIAGALIINFAKDKISSILPEFWSYALGIIFIVVVTVMPKGLAGMFPEGGVKLSMPAFLRKPKAAAITEPASETA